MLRLRFAIGWLMMLTGAAAWAAPNSPPLFPGVRSVAWIGAHPDDESLAAPVLARLCVDERLACSFLVFTHGEAGHCLIPGGCKPDLGTVRAGELARSAALFGARLTLWTFSDGGAAGDGTPGAWDAEAGGHEALLARVAGFLADRKPDLVLTFDPRHGSTCHPDHRAVAGLVRDVTAGMPSPPALFLVEHRVLPNTGEEVRFVPAAPAAAGVFGFDANLPRRTGGASDWQALVDVLTVHRSQFSAAKVQSIRATPPRLRTVPLAPAAAVLASPDVFTCGE
jgi:LmbE family N-acetylglucosaminyl deacetylase